VPAFAVLRVDDGPPDHSSRVQEFVSAGEVVPAAGPANVCVKEVVMTADEARREVIRLNALTAGRGCRYFWQATHVFIDGGSHGSQGRKLAEQQDAEQGVAGDRGPQSS
jgi:hypothetical protein